MNKKVLKAVFATALVAAAGYGVYTFQSSQTELSDTALANVEALASGESPCPNGCHANGLGCQCYTYYPTLREHQW